MIYYRYKYIIYYRYKYIIYDILPGIIRWNFSAISGNSNGPLLLRPPDNRESLHHSHLKANMHTFFQTQESSTSSVPERRAPEAGLARRIFSCIVVYGIQEIHGAGT